MRNSICNILGISMLLAFCGCRQTQENKEDNDTVSIEKAIDTNSILQNAPIEEVGSDDIAPKDTVNPYATPSTKELMELQEFISCKLGQLKGNPLQQNVWGISRLPNAVEVLLTINTPYWQNEFKKSISDSPYIIFEGPSKPNKIKIEEVIDSIIEYSNIKLYPERPLVTSDSEFASFIISNNSDNDIKFGEKYIIGFKDADGIWYELPQTGICNDIGIELKPTGKYSFEAALHPSLNNNKPGVYRLYKRIRLGNNKNYVWLMTEFILE